MERRDSRGRTKAAESGADGSRRLRVVELIDDAAVGGGQRHVLDLATGLDPARWEVAVACEEAGWLVDRLGEGGLPVLPVRMGNRPDLGVHLALRRHLRRFGADLIHTHGGTAGFHGRMAARSLGIPAVHTYHGLHALRSAGGTRASLFRAVDRWLASRTARLVCVSAADAVLARREDFAPEGRSSVVPNGIRVAEYARAVELRAQRRAAAAGDGLVVGSIGRLNPEKGHLAFVEAAALVRTRRTDVRFVLVGEGAEGERLRGRARELKLGEAFARPGARFDVVDQLASFDLFVLPSRWEGHPIVLLEAMAAGLPVVASDIDGVREIVVDRRTGILVKPGDPMALAGAILELASEPARAAAMGAAARESVARYDLSRTVGEIERIYRAVLGVPDPAGV